VLTFIEAIVLGAIALTVCSGSLRAQSECLPLGVKEKDIATVTTLKSKNGNSRTVDIPVGQALKNMRARCLRGRLVDRGGRQIRFYFLKGCWGNPPADYLEILDRQRNELEALKKRYTVIEITCDPSGLPPQSRS